jgi:hypothetical protein
MAGGWIITKDALSFLGAVFVSIPWFLDFGARVRLGELKRIQSDMQTLRKLIAGDEAWLVAPKARDLVLTSVGLLALCASFFIALLQSLSLLGA